jgi:hypothetical protein
MDKKYFVPVATMLAGVLVGVVFVILRETSGLVNDKSLWTGAGFCLATGGFMVFSGLRCRQVGGPRVGNIVRTVLLIITAGITCLRAGIFGAGILAAAAIVTGVFFLTGSKQPKAA